MGQNPTSLPARTPAPAINTTITRHRIVVRNQGVSTGSRSRSSRLAPSRSAHSACGGGFEVGDIGSPRARMCSGASSAQSPAGGHNGVPQLGHEPWGTRPSASPQCQHCCSSGRTRRSSHRRPMDVDRSVLPDTTGGRHVRAHRVQLLRRAEAKSATASMAVVTRSRSVDSSQSRFARWSVS